MNSTRSQSQLCTATPISLFSSVFPFHFGLCLLSCHTCFKGCLAQVISLVAQWIDTYGICHWIIFRCSYKKLDLFGFEPKTTEFRSDALTDWAIKPFVQLVLWANFVQLFQIHLFVQWLGFISVFAFASHHICLKCSLAQVITLVEEWTSTYGVHHWKIFKRTYRNLAWLGFEPMTIDFRSDALANLALRSWVQLSLRANFLQLLHFHFCMYVCMYICKMYLTSVKKRINLQNLVFVILI